VTFRMGGEDAQHFVHEYTPVFIERDLINLGVREFYCKISINGEIHKAFSGRTIFMEKQKESFAKEIIEHSRQSFGVNLEEQAIKLAKQMIIDRGGVVEEDVQIDKRLYELPFPEPS